MLKGISELSAISTLFLAAALSVYTILISIFLRADVTTNTTNVATTIADQNEYQVTSILDSTILSSTTIKSEELTTSTIRIYANITSTIEEANNTVEENMTSTTSTTSTINSTTITSTTITSTISSTSTSTTTSISTSTTSIATTSAASTTTTVRPPANPSMP